MATAGAQGAYDTTMRPEEASRVIDGCGDAVVDSGAKLKPATSDQVRIRRRIRIRGRIKITVNIRTRIRMILFLRGAWCFPRDGLSCGGKPVSRTRKQTTVRGILEGLREKQKEKRKIATIY